MVDFSQNRELYLYTDKPPNLISNQEVASPLAGKVADGVCIMLASMVYVSRQITSIKVNQIQWRDSENSPSSTACLSARVPLQLKCALNCVIATSDGVARGGGGGGGEEGRICNSYFLPEVEIYSEVCSPSASDKACVCLSPLDTP